MAPYALAAPVIGPGMFRTRSADVLPPTAAMPEALTLVKNPASGVTVPMITLLSWFPPPLTVPPSVCAGSVQVAAAVYAPPTEATVLITGVVSVGVVPNTSAPLPVSFVTAAARLSEVGVCRNARSVPAIVGRPAGP